MPYALVTDPAEPGNLYAGLADGAVWFAADFGDHWERIEVNVGVVERAMAVLWP